MDALKLYFQFVLGMMFMFLAFFLPVLWAIPAFVITCYIFRVIREEKARKKRVMLAAQEYAQLTAASRHSAGCQGSEQPETQGPSGSGTQ